jgi:hypothetical protein
LARGICPRMSSTPVKTRRKHGESDRRLAPGQRSSRSTDSAGGIPAVLVFYHCLRAGSLGFKERRYWLAGRSGRCRGPHRSFSSLPRPC